MVELVFIMEYIMQFQEMDLEINMVHTMILSILEIHYNLEIIILLQMQELEPNMVLII